MYGRGIGREGTVMIVYFMKTPKQGRFGTIVKIHFSPVKLLFFTIWL